MRMIRKMLRVPPVVLPVLLFAAVVGQVGAQVPDTSRFDGSKAMLVRLSLLPDTVHAVVVRRVEKSPHQLIVIGPRTTAEDLTRAIGVLGALRAVDGDTPHRSSQVIVSGSDANTAGVRGEAARIQKFLDAVETAAERTIPGVGQARAVDIDLGPRPVVRGATRR
jgi:hypothetical protein